MNSKKVFPTSLLMLASLCTITTQAQHHVLELDPALLKNRAFVASARSILGFDLPANATNESQFSTTRLDNQLVQLVMNAAPQKIRELASRLQNGTPTNDQNFVKLHIFYGPSGTGKSTLAKALAQTCGLPFYFYSSAGLGNPFKDSGKNTIKNIFSNAKKQNQPCVIIFDELDALIKRHMANADSDAGMLNTFFDCLQNQNSNKILCITTLHSDTDVPKDIKAKLAPYILQINLPSKEQRRECFKYLISQYHPAIDSTILTDDSFLNIFSDKTSGLNYFELQGIVDRAYLNSCISDHPKITKTGCCEVLEQLLAEKKRGLNPLGLANS